MIKLSNINKSFGDKGVLKNISFEAKNNSIIGLLGPNGAGKTTLMRVIVGFYQANGGEVVWNNETVDTKSIEYRKIVGYLPENNPLYLLMTAGEYLTMIAGLKESGVETEVKRVAGECNILEVLGQKLETLSKGYRQRVGLAAALIGDPKILVLDEPTSGLDPNQIIEIRGLIKSLAKKKLVIFSTHILPEAKAICDRLLIINRGEIVLDDETKKIINLEKKFVELTV